MKREEKLQSQQLNGDFTVRTWISSLWSRSIINKLQGNSICKKNRDLQFAYFMTAKRLKSIAN